ncbi:hypothetical protein PBCVIL52s1_872L [Paramecium bursaria Chlorella virus IL-5-2s1]|nr:hypothetical protein PBCVIL52s1_872L [Paramecium bursaria Chlorella virus IL-5-2s1]
MIKTLDYYFDDGRHIVFDKYTIDTFGIIRNMNNKEMSVTTEEYCYCSVYKDEKQYTIRINRAIASTFLGPPPSIAHTADHIDRNPTNNHLDNIRWLCKNGQSANRLMPETNKSSFIIVKDNIEKTVKEWIDHLKDNNTPYGNSYTKSVIEHYAQRKQHGFSYKVFEDLPGERWKIIPGTLKSKNHWEMSNKSRVKQVTTHASNVLDATQMHKTNGYPSIYINRKQQYAHIMCFYTFFPDEYSSKKPNEIILHKYDDKLDFRPENLRLGTHSQNRLDAYDNGRFDNAKIARQKCVSYINGVEEKEHESLSDAVRYLREKGYPKASQSNISSVIGTDITRYGRTWGNA